MCCAYLCLSFLCVKRVWCPEGCWLLFPLLFDIWGVGLFSVSGLYTSTLCDISCRVMRNWWKDSSSQELPQTQFKALSLPMFCLLSRKKIKLKIMDNLKLRELCYYLRRSCECMCIWKETSELPISAER